MTAKLEEAAVDNRGDWSGDEDPRRYLIEAGDRTYTVIMERTEGPGLHRTSATVIRRRHMALVTLITLIGLVALPTLYPRDLGVLGLASSLPLFFYLALGTLIIGFAIAASFHADRPILATYVIGTATILHGLSPAVYEYLRFPWAWKHVGVVDFIQRTGGVDRNIELLGAYHNWPGFFSFNALLTDLGGVDTAVRYAHLAPVVFNLLFLGALYIIFRRFTQDSRLITTGLMVFTIGNWVGQDYFAPQAVAFFFYLIIVAILLTWFFTGRSEVGSVERRAERPVASIILVLIVAAVAVTHQLTPWMLVAVLAAFTVLGELKAKWPLLAAVLVTLIWLVTFASPFVSDYFPRVLDDLRNLGGRLNDGLIDYGHVDTSQRYVSLATRLLTASVLGLAGLGFFRQLRGLRAWRQAIILGGTPLLLVVASTYGDEILFRAYLFVLPMAALFAATLWFPPKVEPPGWLTTGTLTAALLSMSMLSVVSMHGNDIYQTFTRDELAAATLMYDTATPGSGVIQLNNSYPTKFKDYENLSELDVASFSPAAKDRFVSDPSYWFERWLAEGEFSDGFVLITRTQKAEVERLGFLPAGSVDFILDDLRAAPAFDLVFDSDDGTLFQLRESRE
jgi:hypothetical protein